ncbi:hypothetical protein Adt_15092 [Abeliophyllum distichum]|uniref:Uncharacterized protein n=1 Tax=Abeliophyllum distichum TaxID=126358 RepID=A0ABD1U1I3_9LAMI
MEDKGKTRDTRRARRGQVMTLSQKTKRSTECPRDGTWATAPALSDWTKRIDIGFRWDELDLIVLDILPILLAMATTSIHKYWTFTWKKAAEQANMLELVKLAEMKTVQSHVLNFELYMVLVGFEGSKAVGSEDTNELRSENKILYLKLEFVEEARQPVEYKMMKAEMMQNVCNEARRRAELTLKVYEDMTYAKHKELA